MPDLQASIAFEILTQAEERRIGIASLSSMVTHVIGAVRSLMVLFGFRKFLFPDSRFPRVVERVKKRRRKADRFRSPPATLDDTKTVLDSTDHPGLCRYVDVEKASDSVFLLILYL